jgi:hypothetical protein
LSPPDVGTPRTVPDALAARVRLTAARPPPMTMCPCPGPPLVESSCFTRCRRQAPTGRCANPTLLGGSDDEAASTDRCGQERLGSRGLNKERAMNFCDPTGGPRSLSPGPRRNGRQARGGPTSTRCFRPRRCPRGFLEDDVDRHEHRTKARGPARRTARRVWGRSRHRPGAVAGPASGSRA